MTDTLALNLRFLSDWHLGEGAGARGHVDAVVRRDPRDGLPYVPAKTLTGMLRDGCERIVYGLDGQDPAGPWHGLLREVFGGDREDEADRSAREASLSIGAARLDASLRRAICTTPGMGEALVFLKPGVKLDRRGVAETGMIRFEEVVLAGAELRAPVSLALDGERREQAMALIGAGARAVERMGAKRRRGAGRCELSLAGGPSLEETVDRLGRRPADVTAGPNPRAARLHLGGGEPASGGGRWYTIALDLDLETPVVVPAETLGNFVTTRDHLPGALLLPALDAWLRVLLGARTTGAVARGAVQVRNAYPSADGHRLLPVPAALFKRKEGGECTNHLRGEPPPDDHRQRKQLRAGFVATDALPAGGEEAVLRVATTAITHATIQDSVQRPTAAVGGVYTYEALRPGQRLSAELWVDTGLLESADDLDAWLDKAPKTLRIGRAKKDDYGRVSLTCRKIDVSDPLADGERLTLWLASPLLLRDDGLAPVMDAAGVTAELERALGPGLRLEPEAAGQGAFLRPWRDDGWNNAWQMRRATRFGVAPGSCLAFRVAAGKVTAEDLARIQARGLGERRGEGYGELVCNAPLLGRFEVRRRALELDRPPAEPAGALRPTEFSRALQRRAARIEIRRKALTRDVEFRKQMGWCGGQSPRPPNTQLGALRARIEALHDRAGMERVRAWLRAVQANDKRRDKWPRKTVERLETHLDEHAVASIWGSLDMASGPTALPGHDGGALAEEMWIEAIKTLWLTAISRQLNENNRSAGKAEGAREGDRRGT